MSLATCGLWPGRSGLVAAVLDSDGMLARTGLLPPDEAETGRWLSAAVAHCGPGLDLVLTEQIARHHRVSQTALELGYRAWVAPPELVRMIASAAWWRPTSKQLAAMLARLPRIRSARVTLRRLPLDPGPRQLRLF